MEERKNPITRREKIIVESGQINQYGDLIVKTRAGNEYKIGKKREFLFDVFQPGIEVIIGWAVFMNREYIAEATQAAQVISTDTPVSEEKSKESPKKSERPQGTTAEGKNRSFALAYSKDLAVAKIMVGKETSLGEILTVALAFESYLDTGAKSKGKEE